MAVLAAILLPWSLPAQNEEGFRAYTDPPRLLLRPQRLRLLQREKQRESMRWQQFDALVSGKANMPEAGFAYALYSLIAAKPQYCRDAQRGAGQDLRQMALVYDWCQVSEMAPALKQAADRAAKADDVPTVRNRAFAALALADAEPKWSEATMKDIVERSWRGVIVPKLRQGAPLPRNDTYALFELLHAVRDNLQIDLRDPIQGFFRELPIFHLLSYYPAAYPGPENEFRIPYYQQDGEPDLRIAALSRAAELSMVAFDNNSTESQAMQSWILQDRFLMRGPFGIVYEFLWANPYQPGITYHALPNAFHDKRGGRLFLRSNWEEEATFFCYDNGKGQVFEAGKRADVNVLAQRKPIRIGAATVIVGTDPTVFEIGQPVNEPAEADADEAPAGEPWFVVGLKPNAPYDVEADDEEMWEARTDAGGTLSFDFKKPRRKTVRIHPPQNK